MTEGFIRVVEGFISVVSDISIPVRHCVVKRGDKTVYAGPLGGAATPFIRKGFLLILNPIDFADGEDFIKKQIN